MSLFWQHKTYTQEKSSLDECHRTGQERVKVLFQVTLQCKKVFCLAPRHYFYDMSVNRNAIKNIYNIDLLLHKNITIM